MTASAGPDAVRWGARFPELFPEPVHDFLSAVDAQEPLVFLPARLTLPQQDVQPKVLHRPPLPDAALELALAVP